MGGINRYSERKRLNERNEMNYIESEERVQYIYIYIYIDIYMYIYTYIYWYDFDLLQA